MGNVAKPNTFSPSTTISSSQINANFDTIYNEFNGNISASNLATDAVTTAKIADANVTTAKLADDAVTAPKVNFGGSGAGVWWEEIARTTLSVAGDTITVSSIPARKYLLIIISTVDTGGTTSNTIRFNNDSGTNYAATSSSSGGADATSLSATSIITSGAVANPIFVSLEVFNTPTQEKLCYIRRTSRGVAGAGSVPTRLEMAAKWVNTSNQISRVDVINSGTGDFAIDSEVIVLGHD